MFEALQGEKYDAETAVLLGNVGLKFRVNYLLSNSDVRLFIMSVIEEASWDDYFPIDPPCRAGLRRC